RQFKTVVFICTGNFYRSRFSEDLFNALARKHGLHWRATSRGLRAKMNDGPLSEFAAYRLTAMGVPFDGERYPIQLSEADLENAHLVVALKKAEHHAMMLEQFPNWAEKIQYWRVDDIDCATPDEAMPICESCVKSLVKTLLAEQKRQEAPARLRRAGATSKIVFGPKRSRIY
ncbi:MAG: hypothetical protein ABSG53_28835, partial [Thermoguttaceae bacterium]